MSYKASQQGSELGIRRSNKSLNKAGTNLPVIKTNRQVEAPQTKLAVFERKKFFFRKTIPRKSNRLGTGSQSKIKPIEASLKKLRVSMLEREKGWDSRFVNEQIPELYPKEKSSVSKSIKQGDKKMQEKMEQLQKKLMTRQSAKSIKSAMADERRYSTSQAIVRVEEDNVSNGQTVEKNHETNTIKQFTGVNYSLRKDQIYRMEVSYLKLGLPEFQNRLVREVYRQIKESEQLHIMHMNPKEFKAFLESTAQIHRSVRILEKVNILLTNKPTQINEVATVPLKELGEMLAALSILSLDVVESTVLWRQCTSDIVRKYKITGITPNLLSYELTKGQNYLLNLMNDTQPIFESQLYPNASYPDPFLLSYPFNNFFEERDLIYKIRASQLTLLEECLKIDE